MCACFTCILSRVDETLMLNADILPKLNYVSMTWNDHSTSDSRSPADMTSVVSAVNAAAIKYLNDRQLVQQAVAASSKGRHTLSRPAAASSSNASIYGVKSANLSLASKKYFEKHGLGTNRGHPGVAEAQSVTPKQMSKSKMEDLLNSITSQVNGLQVTMSPPRSVQTNTTSDEIARHFNNSLSFNSTASSVDSERSQSLPRRHRGRKSLDGSALSDALSDETCISRGHHMPCHRSSLDSSQLQQAPRYTASCQSPNVGL